MINYQNILKKNMLKVFKDILNHIKKDGLNGNQSLYITFLTNHKKVDIPIWLKEKYPDDMTIVIQYEYYDLEINEDRFQITLSFNDIKTKMIIGYTSIISFADPSANFGLRLLEKDIKINEKKKSKINKKSKKNNIIDFADFKNTKPNKNH